MLKKLIIPSIIFAIASSCTVCDAFEDFSSIKEINPNESNMNKSETVIDLENSNGSPKIIYLNKNDTFYSLASATDRFVQCNVRAAYDDFKSLISNVNSNDFTYISIANKMADLGFFDLAYIASGKVKDSEISKPHIDSMKRFYFPKKKLRLEDELFLAEIYSNITFNEQSSEATNELLKKPSLLSTSDYANYLVALGSYKSNFYTRANQYIDFAILQNPTNLNYQKLKAEILSDNDKPQEAIKLVENLKKQNLFSHEYNQKVKALEQFVLYKTSKNSGNKNYHLGYYYYLENDASKAIRTLQGAFSKKKNNNALVYSLMSEVYLSMNEFEKASDTAKKSHKINSNIPRTLISLGDLRYREGDYKQALKYYKQAASGDKSSYVPLVKEAMCYQKLANNKKASEIYTKVLKTHSDSYEAYFNVALMDKSKELIYLKKSLGVNLLYKDAWIELARIETERGNFDTANKYLSNVYYIDENDFRYYYYQGMVNKAVGDYTQASFNFKKCLKLNNNYKPAQKELETLFDVNVNQVR